MQLNLFGNSGAGSSTGTTSCSSDGYGPEYLVETRVVGDTIELTYRRDATYSFTGGYNFEPPPKIFKRIYKAELIETKEGKYCSRAPEYYQFD